MSVFLLQYLSGFGNELSSEDPRCPGSLPEGQVYTSTETHTELILALTCDYLFTNFAHFLCLSELHEYLM